MHKSIYIIKIKTCTTKLVHANNFKYTNKHNRMLNAKPCSINRTSDPDGFNKRRRRNKN